MVRRSAVAAAGRETRGSTCAQGVQAAGVGAPFWTHRRREKFGRSNQHASAASRSRHRSACSPPRSAHTSRPPTPHLTTQPDCRNPTPPNPAAPPAGPRPSAADPAMPARGRPAPRPSASAPSAASPLVGHPVPIRNVPAVVPRKPTYSGVRVNGPHLQSRLISADHRLIVRRLRGRLCRRGH